MKIVHASRYLVVAAMLVVSAFFAKPGDAATGKQPDIAAVLNSWKAAVESGKLEDIMALYDKNAYMTATFAQNPFTKREQIEGYYKLVIVNEGIKVDILESHPRVFGDIATDDGRYEISYLQEGEEVRIPARFTFVYKLVGGKWLIIDHHASQMPDTKEKK